MNRISDTTGCLLWGSVLFWALWSILSLGGCAAPVPEVHVEEEAPAGMVVFGSLSESAPADGPWRPHKVSWCAGEMAVPQEVEELLALCFDFFQEGSGTDGMLELELALEAGKRHPLVLVTLGQLYLIAGQGEPDLLPPEGPAADVGNWPRNKVRLLHRAESLLSEASSLRPDEAAIDYLLADVWRAREDFLKAKSFVFQGAAKCTQGRMLATLAEYQELNPHPGRFLGGPDPVYPEEALAQGVSGEVVLDLLISPLGEVRQATVVAGPSVALAEAAAVALSEGEWEAGTVGKYGVWSWLRVHTNFALVP